MVSGCDEGMSVYNGHFELEVLIERPVVQVWRQYLDMASWVTSHDIENAYGAPGTVGSITRVSSKRAKERGAPPPHHHYCKLIKLVPERQYVLKTYTGKDGAYGMYMIAFDDTRFLATGGQTKIIFNLFVEARSEAIAKESGTMNLDGSREGMLGNLNNLKRILEGQ
jgi:uncharacterized protein YndB with AHSA1/START domain